ncbi:Mitochondrial outer membrane protein porin of 36 kDa [Capsicum chinense]|nr:Mitochondrial outer membrane protein porin of 36 kDa [Capsicum chinense]
MLGPSKLMPKLVAGIIGRSFAGVPPESEVVETRSGRNQKYRLMDPPDRSLVTGAARCLCRRGQADGDFYRRRKFERRRGTGNGREKRVERRGGVGLSLPVTGAPTPSPASSGQGAVVVGLVNVYTTITVDEPAPGLKTIVSFVIPNQKSGKVELQYLHENDEGDTVSASYCHTVKPVTNTAVDAGRVDSQLLRQREHINHWNHSICWPR